MRTARIALFAAAGLLAGGSLAVLATVLGQPSAPVAGASATAVIGGAFSMVDDRGARVTEADLVGQPSVLFFGFTWCPDICPTTLFELTALMDALGPEADAMRFVMVSADPERDTPAILNEYLAAFDPRLRGFTGTPAEVARIAAAYGVRIERVGTGERYTVNHTASVFLMDSQNRFRGTITPHEDPATALEKLRLLAAAA